MDVVTAFQNMRLLVFSAQDAQRTLMRGHIEWRLDKADKAEYGRREDCNRREGSGLVDR